MQYDETFQFLPPGFNARHSPRLVFSTTATAWFAWALFLLAGSYSLFTDMGPAMITAWALSVSAGLAAWLQFYVLRRRGAARIWREGDHFEASVLGIRHHQDSSEVRVRFADLDGITRLMQLEMPASDAERISTKSMLHVAFLDGELTYHYLPKDRPVKREMAM